LKTTRRSWLAKAKSIHDIGGMFYAPKAGEPWDLERDARAEEKWGKLTRRPLPVEEAFARYYGSRMHDSTVMGIDRDKGRLRIRLDSIDARDFARILARVLDVPEVETLYPVDLLLHDPQHVRAARAGISGELRFTKWESLEDVEFLYDWFFEQDGRLQWIAQLYAFLGHDTALSPDVYLLVDAARVTAEDRCPAAFARAYSAPAARLYEDALAGRDDRPIDFNVFDSPQTEEYILRRMGAHGLTFADFTP
jgi:hypothetical protein